MLYPAILTLPREENRKFRKNQRFKKEKIVEVRKSALKRAGISSPDINNDSHIISALAKKVMKRKREEQKDSKAFKMAKMSPRFQAAVTVVTCYAVELIMYADLLTLFYFILKLQKNDKHDFSGSLRPR